MRALPTALLLLLFATPTFAAATTPHDPFRALAILVPKPPEEPICCLKPLTPLEPDDDDLFLSFEQWKERRLAEATPREHTGAGGWQNGGGSAGTGESPPADAAAVQSASTPPSGDAAGAGADVADSAPPPHFRVPLTDRFNYASLDCSARVHTAHRAAQSAANILSSKKDRYMLSPCAAPTYVVVELCEDIRIDTVQLANFEFFSGVFKEFRVSVRKTYATDLEGWTEVGTYVAKNVRGVQSFHPPTSLRDFYRFIRIDFLSHYGNEYYCPISLLRVYGLTHLEEWKWDVWEEESRAKLEHIAPVVSEEPSQPVQTTSASDEHSGEHPGRSAEATETADLTRNDTGVSEPTLIPPSIDAGRSTEIVRSEPPTSEPTSRAQDAPPPSSLSNTSVSSSTPTQSPIVSNDAHTPVSISSNASTTDTITSISSSPSPSDISNPPPPESHPVHNATSIPKPTISLTPPSPALHPVSSGESIYRTIMNRLSALEANHTLYARYVSDQTSGLRSVLRRLGEDVGRLEGLGRAQAQGYQRAAREFERQRRRMEEERRELLMKVDYLAEEIVLEKRLGIAQLCLLLAVLVFLGLTRGSRPETLDARGSGSAMRAWGRRKLSLSGDWVSRFRRRSRSRSRTPSPPSREDQAHLATPTDSVPFPSASAARAKPHISVGVSRSSSSRRTPRSPRAHHATPPASARPGGLQRSNSQGAGPLGPVLGPVPRSAKRWARSAHLHEVRRVRGEAGAGPAEADKWAPEARSGSPLRVVTNRVGRGEEDGEGEVWVDTDADADVDGSEGGWS